MLLPSYAVLGIQVYENVTNDITTATTKLVAVPTQSAKIEVADKENVTTPMQDMKDQFLTNNSSVPVTQEKNSRKKQDDSNRDSTT